jgi:hypothetical protein
LQWFFSDAHCEQPLVIIIASVPVNMLQVLTLTPLKAAGLLWLLV